MISYYIKLNTILHYIVLYYIILHYIYIISLQYIILYYIISYHVIWHYIILYCIVLYHITLYLHYIITVHYTILYHIISCHMTLYHIAYAQFMEMQIIRAQGQAALFHCHPLEVKWLHWLRQKWRGREGATWPQGTSVSKAKWLRIALQSIPPKLMDILKHVICKQQRRDPVSFISHFRAASGDQLRPKLEASFEKIQ